MTANCLEYNVESLQLASKCRILDCASGSRGANDVPPMTRERVALGAAKSAFLSFITTPDEKTPACTWYYTR